MKKILRKFTETALIPSIGIVVFFLAWSLLANVEQISNVLPSPLEVFDYLVGATTSGILFVASWVTLRRLLFGYAIGLIVGVPLGILCARSRIARDTLGLLALGLQALPSVCWVPFALLWFYISEETMLFVVIMGSVWSLLLSTQHGVMNISPIYIRAARTMGSRGLHTWVNVIMPAAFPSIVGGMKQGWAFAWRSLMAAEIFVQVDPIGLGRLLDNGRNQPDWAQVVGIMLVVVIIGLLADKILFSPWERMLRKRWGLDQL